MLNARRKHRLAGAAICISNWIVCTLEARALLINQCARPLDEISERNAAFIALAASAHADCLGGSFLVAHDENERNLLQRELADLRIHLFIARIELDPQARGFQPRLPGGCLFEMLLRDRHQAYLDGSEPQREGTGVMLDQHAEESFDASVQCT